MKLNLKWPALAAIVLLLGLAWWAFARAAQPAAPRNLDDEALEIGAMLRCPVCQNLPVAFSPAQLAGQMRQVIRQKLEAGESREQIIQYFVDRYGETILLEPPKRGFNLVAWRGPFLVVLVGAIGLYWLLRSWTRTPPPPPPDDLPSVSDEEVAAYEARLVAAIWESKDKEDLRS
ncbi:MAG: cytochrome c-type biogenesis protein CcmH [Chloroflexi bacterium]|nr:cytochrome c-type biogenesis protein CcmH [Chloroflexota bacterium]